MADCLLHYSVKVRPISRLFGLRRCLFLVLFLLVFFFGVFFVLMYPILSLDVTSDKLIHDLQACPRHACNSTASRLLILIPFTPRDLPALPAFLHEIESRTNSPTARVTLQLSLVTPSPEYLNEIQHIRHVVNRSAGLANIFDHIGVQHHKMDMKGHKYEKLLRDFLQGSQVNLKEYCFVQFMSIRTRFLKVGWLQTLIEHTLQASDQDFWIKGPIDMSIKAIRSFKDLELSLYSVYALHCPCLLRLMNYMRVLHPRWPLSRSLAEMMHGRTDKRLAALLSSKIKSAVYSADFKDDAMLASKVEDLYPDLSFIETRW